MFADVRWVGFLPPQDRGVGDGDKTFLIMSPPGFVDAIPVGAVDDEDQTLSSCVIVAPKRTDLVLATDVLKTEAIRLDGIRNSVET